MAKYEVIHRASQANQEKNDVSNNLFESVLDVLSRSSRATDIVASGICEAALSDADRQLHDPAGLTQGFCQAAKSGITGKVIGLGLRACPVLGLGVAGVSLYSFGRETLPVIEGSIPELRSLWLKAYAEKDANKLNVVRQAAGKRFGHTALQLAVNGTMVVIGFGAGVKTGGALKARIDGLKSCSETLRETSGKNAVKAIYIDKVLKVKPPGARIEIDNNRKTIYHADGSYQVDYEDGSRFFKKAGLPAEMHSPNGEVLREVPGLMRIKDKPNGDRIYKYHESGLVETHKPSGTIIRELPFGVVETHRKNGLIYREHPNGDTEVVKKVSGS